MQKVSKSRIGWAYLFFLLFASLIVALDQLSKAWIRSNLAVGQSLPETGFFQITHVQNTGAAFGLFQDQATTLTIIALVGFLALLVYALFIHYRLPFSHKRLGWFTLGLILGGIVGNLTDRLRFGYVTDFIDVGIWPAFNLADSALVVGVIILAYSFLSLARVRDGQP